MLHINKIIVKNFRPYYGEQTFYFGEEEGLSIILGENGIGKSSLVKAIKFALYDDIENPNPFKMYFEINRIAWDEGNYEMSVAIDFTYNSENYVLKRTKSRKHSVVGVPTNDSDFQDNETVLKNGIIVSPTERKELLNNIIPRDISEFILFEGETINKYNKLITKNSKDISDSIRKILGVKILENSLADINSYIKDLEEEKLRKLRQNTKNQKVIEEIDKLREELKSTERELGDNTENLKNLYKERSEIETFLANNVRSKGVLDRLNEIKTQFEVTKTERGLLINSRRDYLESYKSMFLPLMRKMINITPENISSLKKTIEANNLIQENIRNFKKILDKESCMYCGNHISQSEIEFLENNIKQESSKIKNITKDEEDELIKYNNMKESFIVRTRDIQYIDFAKELSKINVEITNADIALYSLNQQRNEQQKLMNELGDSSDLEIKVKRFSALEGSINSLEKQRAGLEAQIVGLNSQISAKTKQMGAAIDISSLDMKIYDAKNIQAIINSSIDVFSDRMRERVQNSATELFIEISENKEYSNIEFDKDYVLKLRHVNGSEVPNISSGYMNLITIALIYGLHTNSSLTGTIILDAPFSVLSEFHKETVVKAFQKLSPQVILLVYKTELQIDLIRREMGSLLRAEYEIYQDRNEQNSSYRTRIRGGV